MAFGLRLCLSVLLLDTVLGLRLQVDGPSSWFLGRSTQQLKEESEGASPLLAECKLQAGETPSPQSGETPGRIPEGFVPVPESRRISSCRILAEQLFGRCWRKNTMKNTIEGPEDNEEAADNERVEKLLAGMPRVLRKMDADRARLLGAVNDEEIYKAYEDFYTPRKIRDLIDEHRAALALARNN